jgi:hypothetical protein
MGVTGICADRRGLVGCRWCRIGGRVIVTAAAGDRDGDAGEHRQSAFHGEFAPRQQGVIAHHFLLARGEIRKCASEMRGVLRPLMRIY